MEEIHVTLNTNNQLPTFDACWKFPFGALQRVIPNNLPSNNNQNHWKMPIRFRHPPWFRHDGEQQNKCKPAATTMKKFCEAKFGGINCKGVGFTIPSRKSAKSNNKQMMECNGKNCCSLRYSLFSPKCKQLIDWDSGPRSRARGLKLLILEQGMTCEWGAWVPISS